MNNEPENIAWKCRNCGRYYRSLFLKNKHEKTCTKNHEPVICFGCMFLSRKNRTVTYSTNNGDLIKDIRFNYCRKNDKFCFRSKDGYKGSFVNGEGSGMEMVNECQFFQDKLDK